MLSGGLLEGEAYLLQMLKTLRYARLSVDGEEMILYSIGPGATDRLQRHVHQAGYLCWTSKRPICSHREGQEVMDD